MFFTIDTFFNILIFSITLLFVLNPQFKILIRIISLIYALSVPFISGFLCSTVNVNLNCCPFVTNYSIGFNHFSIVNSLLNECFNELSEIRQLVILYILCSILVFIFMLLCMFVTYLRDYRKYGRHLEMSRRNNNAKHRIRALKKNSVAKIILLFLMGFNLLLWCWNPFLKRLYRTCKKRFTFYLFYLRVYYFFFKVRVKNFFRWW